MLVLVATLPLLAFATVLLEHAYRASSWLIEDTALSTARRAAALVEAQIGRVEAIAYALAELPPTDFANLGTFEDAVGDILAAAKIDADLEIIDRDGHVIANTLSADHGQLPQNETPEITRRVFETGKPQLSDVYIGALSHQAQIAVHVPLIRDGVVRYDIAVMPSARSLGSIAGASALPEHWFTIVVDRAGRIIADTSTTRDTTGETLPTDQAALLARANEGFDEVIDRRGKRTLVGFTHADHTGWTVAAGVSAWVVRGPLLRSIGALGAVGGAVLLGSLGLAWLIGRSIVAPLGALAQQAAALHSTPRPDRVGWGGLAEIAEVADALHHATAALSARDKEREAALQRAQASEATLLLAQEIGEIGTWENDLLTGIRIWSQGQFKLFGLDPANGAPDAESWLAMIHRDDRGEVVAAERRVAEHPSTYRQLFRINQPNGDIRWLRSAGQSQFEDGRAVRLVGSTIDVTDRHEAERKLQQSANHLAGQVVESRRELSESEERFRTYFEYSSDALLVIRAESDDRFIFETANTACERMFGLSPEQVIGRTPEDLFTPETAFAKESEYRQAIRRVGEKITVQRTLTYPSGPLHLETMMMTVRDPADPNIIRIISGSRDLTERQRIEGRLAHAQRLEAVGQLTGGVAHDFNNLLTVVIGNLSLLRRRLENDERSSRYLASVEAAAQRGAKLTASLLAFSRRQTLNVEQLDVAARIRESATLLQRALGEEVEFDLHIDDDVLPANADASQLEAAVLNLVINARDAMLEAMAARRQRGGRLAIRVRNASLEAADLLGNDEARPGAFVAIAVADTGAGMDTATRTRAFEPFFTTKEIGHGTGLGLSQVFGFVRQLGGHVVIDSTVDVGTEVTIFLPVAMAGTTGPVEPPPEPDIRVRGATVLVVEDDDSIREITAEMLRDVGLRVLTATTAPAALEVLRGQDRVDLLFSDVVMPGGATGVDLARAALELRPSLQVLLTSGYAGMALRRYGAVAEFAILAKPYTRSGLLERIGIMLAPAPAK